MKKSITGKQHLICFRRWSRKGYAAFCSLGRCVVIGCLKKGIADASLRKQPHACTLLTARRPDKKGEWEEEADEDISLAIMEGLSAQVVHVQVQPVAEQGETVSIIIDHIGGRTGAQCICPAFLYTH